MTLLAQAVVATFNLNATTIHSDLNIPAWFFGKRLPSLSDKMRSILKNKLPEVKVVIIDEISVVSNDLLLHVHLRLVEVFACSKNTPFAGITVIAVGDFLQLPSVRVRPVYAEYNNSLQNLDALWDIFEVAELTEVMRQCSDDKFINLLNPVRTAV